MFRTDLTSQPNLFPLSVREMINDDSDVWLYVDLFDQLDLSLFVADYVEQGQAGIDPTLMLRSIFYGLTHGVVSGRKLAQACRSDVRRMSVAESARHPPCPCPCPCPCPKIISSPGKGTGTGMGMGTEESGA